MQDRGKFLETLDELIQIASINDNSITMDEIKEMFEGAELGEEQFAAIYAYLAENKISIKNYIPVSDKKEEIGDTATESAYLQMYLEDIQAVEQCGEEELAELCQKICAGNDAAKTRMIEGNLEFVVNLAKEYKGKGIPIGDLIQEGNMGLMDAVNSIGCLEKDAKVREYLEEAVRGAIHSALMEHNSEDKAGQEAVVKVNRLSKAAKELEEELGRHPEVAEVAQHMGISMEETEDIIRLSQEALKAGHHHK